MKKLICILLILTTMGLSIYADGGYSDIKESYWYYSSVMRTERFIKGYPDGSFKPNEKLTREMAAQILYNLEGNGEKYDSYSFTDVKAGTWYADAVEWMYQNGYTYGISEECYGVGQYVTRQDLITLIYRVYQTEWESYRYGDRKYMTSGGLEKFKDRKDVADYAQVPMIFACRLAFVIVGDVPAMVEAQYRIMVGHNGMLRPRDYCTRAEAAVIFANTYDIIIYYA